MAKQYDEIGIWSELKLSIIRDYATEYSKILSNQPGLRHMYIDGFAGPGVHLSRRTGQFVAGSPLNALEITPPFKEFHFIDADEDRSQQLKAMAGDRPEVYTLSGDCNEILPRDVFPRPPIEAPGLETGSAHCYHAYTYNNIEFDVRDDKIACGNIIFVVSL